jgi:hypothetical protein
MRSRFLLVAAALLASPLAAQAQSPIQLSLFPPAQLVSEGQDVSGIRFGLYTKNANTSGFDLAAVAHSTGNATALQVSLVNYVEGDFTGLQLGWGLGGAIANVVKGQMKGFQGGIYNGAGQGGEGFQWGLVNNTGGRMSGFQLSFVNIAEDYNGIQVGLINIIKSKPSLSILPIVNWKLD